VFKSNVQSAEAGENIGLQIRGIKADALEKGMLVIQPKSLEPTNHFLGTCYFLTPGEGGRSRPFMNKYIQMMYMDTWNAAFRMDFTKDMEGDMIMPGEQATVKMTLLRTMPMYEGQGFTLRENRITVGTGIVTKLLAPIPTHKNNKLIKLEVPP
jgi:elongation factor Tu